jgi:hypothetical protein
LSLFCIASGWFSIPRGAFICFFFFFKKKIMSGQEANFFYQQSLNYILEIEPKTASQSLLHIWRGFLVCLRFI